MEYYNNVVYTGQEARLNNHILVYVPIESACNLPFTPCIGLSSNCGSAGFTRGRLLYHGKAVTTVPTGTRVGLPSAPSAIAAVISGGECVAFRKPLQMGGQ